MCESEWAATLVHSLSLSFGVASGPECERIELSKDRQIKQLLTNVDCCCWCTYLPNVIFISLRRWKLLLPVLEWGRQDGSWIKKVDRFRVTATVVGKERERETERTWRLKEHQHGASKRASKQGCVHVYLVPFAQQSFENLKWIVVSV